MSEDLVGETRRTYDGIAQAYDERTRTPTQELLAFKAEFCRRVSGPVADLGCGPGRDLAMLREAGLTAVGIDLSNGMLQLAQERGPVVRRDLRQPPLRAGSLGGIWSSAALLHVPRPDVPATLSAWHELLTPGGLLGLSTSMGTDEGWELVLYAGPGPDGAPLHRWFVHHEEGQLLGLLHAAGFTVLSASRRASHRDWLMVLARADA